MSFDIQDRLLFISDPGHGWLRVSWADFAAASDDVKKSVSSYSYIDNKFIYLEEDCDAYLYLKDLCGRLGVSDIKTFFQACNYKYVDSFYEIFSPLGRYMAGRSIKGVCYD
jgi:hypothetical protein